MCGGKGRSPKNLCRHEPLHAAVWKKFPGPVNFLYPKIPLRQLALMLALTLGGALVAGFYGILHDQITYSLGPEYFTRLKFHQFAWANVGFPPRIYAGEIGFIATWWVGAIVGWTLARIAVPAWPPRVAAKLVATGIRHGVRVRAGRGNDGIFAWADPAAQMQIFRIGTSISRHFESRIPRPSCSSPISTMPATSAARPDSFSRQAGSDTGDSPATGRLASSNPARRDYSRK